LGYSIGVLISSRDHPSRKEGDGIMPGRHLDRGDGRRVTLGRKGGAKHLSDSETCFSQLSQRKRKVQKERLHIGIKKGRIRAMGTGGNSKKRGGGGNR